MKILHVITSLRTGGAEKLMVDLLPLLKSYGNEVELLLFDGIRTPFFKQLDSLNIPIHSIKEGGSVYDPRNIFYIRKIVSNYDIVHSHNTSPQLFSIIAKALSHCKSTKFVTTEHNTTNRRRRKIIFKPIDRWMYQQYDKVICVSNNVEEELRRYLGDDSSNICTIYNGIDLSRFSCLTDSSHEELKDSFIITMVAAFRKQKDQMTLIRALSMLPKNFKLQFVGTGDEELIDKAKRLVNELNLIEQVEFLGVRTNVPEIMRASSIVVLSSHWEGFGLSAVEGMASGRPFIASDVDGLREIVGGYGLLFPHEDAQALADIIMRLSQDKTYAEQIATKCQERAKQFDIAVMAQKYNCVYKVLFDNEL